MTRKEYIALRTALMNQAQELLNEGDFDNLTLKKKEVEELDDKYKAISEEQANLHALENNVPKLDLENSSVKIPAARIVGATDINNEIKYEDVFAKVALQRTLTDEEINVFNQYNPENVYIHSTTNTDILIPETTVGGIMEMAKELHPILNEITETRIKGTVRYLKHTGITGGDAKYYDEATAVEDESNTFGELTLGGKELAKSVTVSWKLQSMAVEDFIPFLKRELGERIGAAKAYAIVRGAGDDRNPQGIITALKEYGSDGAPAAQQYISYNTEITYEHLTEAFSKISSKYNGGLKVYANNNTIWNDLATIKDANERPIFLDNVIAPSTVGKMFGRDVVVEDALDNGQILIGDIKNGYKMNVQESMRLVTEEHAKARTTDFVGYEINDGGVLDEKAFVLITPPLE